ncbi:MAG: acetate--CoA ligase family protein [Rhodospirillales bacterium]
MTSLDDLLAPRSVAVIGASDDPARIGGRPIAYMKQSGFAGAIHPVNPKRDRIQGLPAVPSVADVAGPVDVAIVALPAPLVNATLQACADKGVKTCIVFSSGFAEESAEGRQRQAEMQAIAKASGLRIVGPNSLGGFNAETGFIATFSTTLDRGPPKPGGLAIASQSGAYGSHIYFTARGRGLGVGKLITTGNEVDLDVAEAIALLAADEATHCIAAYAEGVKDGPRLIRALELARDAAKPVIFMKVGRSEVGAAAAASHTASLAGEDRVYDAVLAQYGAHRAETTEAMLDIAYVSRPRLYPTGNKLGIVTISGGAGVLMADAAAKAGVAVPPMPPEAQAAFKQRLPFATARNPVDVTAQAFNDIDLIEDGLRIVLQQGGYDAIIAFWTSVAGSTLIADKLRAACTAGIGDRRDTLLVHSMLAAPEIVARYEAENYPVFEDPSRAVAALAALMAFGQRFRETRAKRPTPLAPPLPEGPLGERAAKAFLAAAGLPLVADRLVTSAAEAAEAARALDGPLALKISAPTIAHKSEVGGVRLGVAGAEAAGRAYEEILAAVAKASPQAELEGLLVSPMVADGVDCILGAKVDPVFGPLVLFGLGGIFTEILDDVAIRHAPVDEAEAKAMIESLQGLALLQGARGRPAADLEALTAAIVTVSRLIAGLADQVQALEINPLRALPQGALGLDALIQRRTEGAA